MKVGISFCYLVRFVDKSESNSAIFGTKCMELTRQVLIRERPVFGLVWELDPTFFGLGSDFVESWIQLW